MRHLLTAFITLFAVSSFADQCFVYPVPQESKFEVHINAAVIKSYDAKDLQAAADKRDELVAGGFCQAAKIPYCDAKVTTADGKSYVYIKMGGKLDVARVGNGDLTESDLATAKTILERLFAAKVCRARPVRTEQPAAPAEPASEEPEAPADPLVPAEAAE